ncbi:uncharacterized protein LOC129348938 [Amphiprion ocellaris]|uniref:uncharacterized protein LOC129348938 n=1 Tax=Amphiprion ocellaris TaxID=80972 RepID=UPI002410FAD0|nr:uncharacterized protein LOC129348938 [Amphiprion ocellaris]
MITVYGGKTQPEKTEVVSLLAAVGRRASGASTVIAGRYHAPFIFRCAAVELPVLRSLLASVVAVVWHDGVGGRSRSLVYPAVVIAVKACCLNTVAECWGEFPGVKRGSAGALLGIGSQARSGCVWVCVSRILVAHTLQLPVVCGGLERTSQPSRAECRLRPLRAEAGCVAAVSELVQLQGLLQLMVFCFLCYLEINSGAVAYCGSYFLLVVSSSRSPLSFGFVCVLFAVSRVIHLRIPLPFVVVLPQGKPQPGFFFLFLVAHSFF